jgi:hypothetical protein
VNRQAPETITVPHDMSLARLRDLIQRRIAGGRDVVVIGTGAHVRKHLVKLLDAGVLQHAEGPDDDGHYMGHTRPPWQWSGGRVPW